MAVTDRRGRQAHAFTRRFLRVKLCTDWSDSCEVNERVVETVIPGHPMPSIQMTSAFTERQAIKSLQERSLPRDACYRLGNRPSVYTSTRMCWSLVIAWRLPPASACNRHHIYILCRADGVEALFLFKLRIYIDYMT